MTKQARCRKVLAGGMNAYHLLHSPPPKQKPNGQWKMVQTQNMVRRKWKEWQRGKII